MPGWNTGCRTIAPVLQLLQNTFMQYIWDMATPMFSCVELCSAAAAFQNKGMSKRLNKKGIQNKISPQSANKQDKEICEFIQIINDKFIERTDGGHNSIA